MEVYTPGCGCWESFWIMFFAFCISDKPAQHKILLYTTPVYFIALI